MLDPLAALRRAGEMASGTAVLRRAGLLRPIRPDVALRAVAALVRNGVSPAAALEIGAARYPRQVAIADDQVELTFAEATAEADREARSLYLAGVRAGQRVALLSRNHTGFLLTLSSLSALRADIVLLNTVASSSETASVLADQGVTAVVYDDALIGRLSDAPSEVRRLPIWHPGKRHEEGPRPPLLQSSSRPSRFVLLTSGTTGTARASSRGTPRNLEPLLAFLSRIPLRRRDTIYIASPLFHAWGFGNLVLALATSATVVLREHFDPEEALAAIERHRVRVLAAVPTMLQRMVELPKTTFERYDHSSLEVVVSSGSALPATLATRFMDRFGEVLYNLYGSTEAAWAAIATPEDLRLDPATAGKPPHGTSVKIVDGQGNDLPPGEIGRIAVKNSLSLPPPDPAPGAPKGYVLTGDLGHFTAAGMLHVDGREDDMIVSGAENVYPREVEDALSTHPSVREVAVVGVDDRDFGQRLRAYVVAAPDEKVSEAALKEHLRRRLSRFKVPREIIFVEHLPKNAAGKTLSRELTTPPVNK